MSELEIIAEPGSHALHFKRSFNAPRELVFRAYTDPVAIPKWWGPRRLTTQVEHLEPKPGGRWRFVQQDENGNEFAFHGVFHDVAAPETIVQTFEFEGAPGHVSMETLHLTEANGQTQITATAIFQSVKARDAMIQSGMEDGAIETYDRLEELLRAME